MTSNRCEVSVEIKNIFLFSSSVKGDNNNDNDDRLLSHGLSCLDPKLCGRVGVNELWDSGFGIAIPSLLAAPSKLQCIPGQEVKTNDANTDDISNYCGKTIK